MLKLWPAAGRLLDERDEPRVSVTAYPTGAGDGLGTLEMIDLPPGGAVPPSSRDDTHLLTYVREGAVACEDSSGRLNIIRAGEFSRITGAPGARWTTANASRAEWAQLFRIDLGGAATGVEPGCEQKRFSLAERRGKLCLVASPDGREGSLRIHRDAAIYSSILDGGQHVVHELPAGRCAWLHVVAGDVALAGGVVLIKGDGVVVATERAVSFTAREDSEVLLLHLEEPVHR